MTRDSEHIQAMYKRHVERTKAAGREPMGFDDWYNDLMGDDK